MHVLDRRVPRVLAITSLPGLRHWCQCPKMPLLSENLIANRPLALGFMWSSIWTCDVCHRSLVQKETGYSTWDHCLCFLNRRHGVPRSIPQLARHSRVCTDCESPAHHPAKIPYSFKWTMRIIASILFLAMGVTNLVCISCHI